MQKNFVLDTNILIHSNGTALSKFEDNNIWIPTVVTEELDNLKERKDKPETAYSAREAIRALKDLSKKGNLLEGVPTQDGGYLYLLVEENLDEKLPAGWNPAKPDNMILMMTKKLSERDGIKNVILVTNDGNVQLKAMTLGIPVEEYRNDRVDLETLYTGRTARHVTDRMFAKFAESNKREWTAKEKAAFAIQAAEADESTEEEQVNEADEMILNMKKAGKSGKAEKTYKTMKKKRESRVHELIPAAPPRSIKVSGRTFHEGLEDMKENEYVQLESWTTQGGFLAQYRGGRLTELVHQNDSIFGLDMLNEGQKFMKEALMKPETETPLVCARGAAGTGKTLLAIAAGLEQAYNQKKYERVLLCRANIMMGGKDESIGFLPGDEKEKISPLFRAAEDAIHVLFPSQKPEEIMAELMDRGVLDMQAIAYLRGRSITGTFLILDEAQNCSPIEMLSILSRIGVGSKVVVLGDPEQVDNPHLSRRNNGLVYTIDRMAGSSLCDVVTFRETECKRSDLAKEVAQKMKA